MTAIAKLADRIAKDLCGGPQMDWDLLRDLCDERTGGDLDYLQLNILTDSVESRLSKAGAAPRQHGEVI